MTQDRYRNLCLIFPVLFLLSTDSAFGSPEKILPFHSKAYFSRTSSAKPWHAYVLTSRGTPAYKLSFEREYDVNRKLVGINLLLTDAKKTGRSMNLLNPPQNWHGLQPHFFVASDLAQGPSQSVFGAHRTIKIESKGIVVQIDILNARVSPLTGGGFQIDDLQLSITVDNLSS
jgi:hypothetical protein